jgi:hypothetical protein
VLYSIAKQDRMDLVLVSCDLLAEGHAMSEDGAFVP